MNITLAISDDITRCLAENADDLARAALEALALEGARSERLTTEQVRRLLNFQTRYEVDGFLKQHGVFYQLTLDDVEQDAALAWRLSPP